MLDYANGRLEQETITGGVLDGWVLDPSYGGAGSHGDNGRLTGLVGRLNGSTVSSHRFAMEPGTDRLGSVSDELAPGGALNVYRVKRDR